jgi:hypothetical protein
MHITQALPKAVHYATQKNIAVGLDILGDLPSTLQLSSVVFVIDVRPRSL